MRDALKIIGGMALIAALVIGGCALSVAHWEECRRMHPWWYCAGSK